MDFFNKLKTAVVGNAHDLLDRVIDMNSPAAIRQQIRDLESALAQTKSDAVVAAGQVRTLNREIVECESQLETGKLSVKKILEGTAPNKEQVARAKADALVQLQKQIENKKALLATQTETSQKMDTVAAQIEAKHSTLVARLRELENMDRNSKAMEQAADSLNKASQLMNSGVDGSVDDLESKMRNRNDVATEKLNRAMGSVPSEDPEHSAAVDDLLNSLRTESGGK